MYVYTYVYTMYMCIHTILFSSVCKNVLKRVSTDYAKNAGVLVSVIGIEGQECKLENIGSLKKLTKPFLMYFHIIFMLKSFAVWLYLLTPASMYA